MHIAHTRYTESARGVRPRYSEVLTGRAGLQVEKKVKRSDRGPFMREWDFCEFVRQYRTLEWKDKCPSLPPTSSADPP